MALSNNGIASIMIKTGGKCAKFVQSLNLVPLFLKLSKPYALIFVSLLLNENSLSQVIFETTNLENFAQLERKHRDGAGFLFKF